MKICAFWHEKEIRIIVTDVDISATTVSAAAEVALFPLQTELPRIIRRKNILFLTKKTRAEEPKNMCPESTNSSANSTARTTGSTACSTRIKTDHWRRKQETSYDTAKEFNFISNHNEDFNSQKAQQKYKHCKFSGTIIISKRRHWCGVHG